MLLAIVLMISTVGVSVDASDNANVVITGTEVTAKPGDTVDVPIVIEKNSGFCSLYLSFEYSDELTVISITDAEDDLDCDSDILPDYNAAQGVWSADENYTATGNLAVITVTVSDSAEYTTSYPIKINFIESFDVDENDVTVSVTNATIKVTSPCDDAHTPATTWSTDGTYHWKECAISGCGVVIDGTKAAHYSNKTENKATCQKVAVCDVCGVSYGDVASHNWATTYSKDATGHWYACQTSGCGEKNSFGGHTPDHEGPATEDYGIKCSDCLYEIEAQLAHTHVYDKEVVKEVYKASNATCDNAATYYKSCKCGAFQSNETFNYGEPAGHQWLPATCTTPKSCSACPVTEGEALGHTEGTEWKTDGTNHWHICTVSSCGAVIEASKAAHTPDREEPTEEADVLCTECGYMMATIRQVHYHVHSNEWSFNQYEHWHACACSNRAFIAEHEDANLDGKCDICKWDVPLPEGVTAPVATTIPTSPVTGHNSTVWIWTTLAGLFGFICVSANVLRKKK